MGERKLTGACRPVSQEERQRFVDMYHAGASYRQLEEEFGVVPHNRITKWGLTRSRDCLQWQKSWDTREYRKWTAKEDAVLTELWLDRAPVADIMEILKRSRSSITQRARAIGAIKEGLRTCIECRRQFPNFTAKPKLCEACRELRARSRPASLDKYAGWAGAIAGEYNDEELD